MVALFGVAITIPLLSARAQVVAKKQRVENTTQGFAATTKSSVDKSLKLLEVGSDGRPPPPVGPSGRRPSGAPAVVNVPRTGPTPSFRSLLVLEPGRAAPSVASSSATALIIPSTTPGAETALPTTDLFQDVVAVGRPDVWNCTGIVVAPRLVLTAKHCGNSTHVAFGNDVNAAVKVAAISRVMPHPSPVVDVEILVLAEPISIPIRPRRTDASAPAGTIEVVGFGTTDPNGQRGYGIKRHIEVPQTGWGCDPDRSNSLGCVPELEMVVGRHGGNDTCAGDSGAPVFDVAGGRWRLLAVTSRGLPHLGRLCGDGGVYVRVDKLDAWIRDTERGLE